MEQIEQQELNVGLGNEYRERAEGDLNNMRLGYKYLLYNIESKILFGSLIPIDKKDIICINIGEDMTEDDKEAAIDLFEGAIISRDGLF